MRADGPSLTARGVAIARARLERPSTPTGDPDADERLTGAIAGSGGAIPRPQHARDDFIDHIARRTAFFDDAVLHAIEAQRSQVVILGAGYDGRALRFRSPGVRFFEVDHPATQADKRSVLEQVGARCDDVMFVSVDLTEPGLDRALLAAGLDSRRPTLFVCEGVLRYLPEAWFRELFRATAECAAPGSELAASISTRVPDASDAARRAREQREQFLAEAGEPVLTVPDHDLALEWLAGSGWSIVSVDEGRSGRLLVRARR